MSTPPEPDVQKVDVDVDVEIEKRVVVTTGTIEPRRALPDADPADQTLARREIPERPGLRDVYGALCYATIRIIHESSDQLSANGGSPRRILFFVTAFAAQLSLALFIYKALNSMPEVFDLFSKMIPFGIALLCFGFAILIDSILTPSQRTSTLAQRNQADTPRLVVRLSRYVMKTRFVIARLRLQIGLATLVLALLFGTALIFYMSAVHISVPVANPEDDTIEYKSMLIPTFVIGEPQALKDWKLREGGTGVSGLEKIVTENRAQFENMLRYEARIPVALVKATLAALYAIITVLMTIAFTLLFRRKDRVEELLEELTMHITGLG